jgi:Ca-activated chloride channel homolog
MTFAAPQLLWLLLLLPPAMLAFFWWSWRKRQVLMTQFIQARLLPGLVSGISVARQKVRLACLVAAVVCLILALARPQMGFVWQEVKQRGVDVVVAIDTSKSMLAADIAPNRLARAKLAALELMQLAKSDRLGLVAFAGCAFLQCPLTIDDSAFRQSVEALNVNIIPQGGTAIADAIETALTAFKEGENHKVLVLMTDGEDHDSGAVEAARKAAEAGLRIFTIGIGTAEGELLRIKDAKNQDDYVRDEQGQVVKSHLNEDLLRQVAGATDGGFYLPLRGARTIDALYAQGLAQLPKSEHQEKFVKQFFDRYHWPLGLAMILLLVEMLLPERKRETKVKTPPPPPAKSVPPAQTAEPSRATLGPATALLLLLALPGLVFASPSSALREYKAGNYEQALKEYERLLERNSDDPRLHFNAGAAAYRNRQYDEATRQFNQALNSPDINLQELAYYNRGNAQFRQGENNPDPAKRTEAWEKALKDYELSLKLKPQDGDAKFNHEFVKQRLEELKQQQQKQQQSQPNKSDQQKQDQESQQAKQNDQSKPDQNQQSQPSQAQQNPSEQKPDAQQKQQAQQQKQAEDQQKQAARQSQDEQQKQPSASQASSKKQDGDEKDQPAYAANQMTPEQAEQLLDAQKNDEKMLSQRPEGKPADTSRHIKDW